MKGRVRWIICRTSAQLQSVPRQNRPGLRNCGTTFNRWEREGGAENAEALRNNRLAH
jgi:hypothetical protein